MEKFVVKTSYGTFENFTYKDKDTAFELSWEAPADLEDKYKKAFNDYVKSGISALQKELESGAKLAAAQLAKWDKQVSNVVAANKAKKPAAPADLKVAQDLANKLPGFIKAQIEQKKAVFESLFDKIIGKAVDALNAKLKMKLTIAKVKKVLKIIGIAVLVLATIAAAATAAALTFGVAAGPIIGAVGVAISAAGGLANFAKQSKGIWAGGKNEAKNLESVVGEYAQVSKKFDEIMKRQMSFVAAKRAKVGSLATEMKKVDDQVKTLKALAKNMPDVAKRVTAAEAAQKTLATDFAAMEQSVKEQEALLQKAASNKDFNAAVALAAKMKEDEKWSDKVLKGAEFIGNILNSVGQAIGG